MLPEPTTPLRRVLLDVDGVVADFHRAAHEFYGRPYGPEQYAVAEYDFWRSWPMRDEEFWGGIAKHGRFFWEGLPEHADSRELVEFCQNSFAEFAFCTAPPELSGAYEGRVNWLRAHFPGVEIVITRSKHLCARPDTLLIDDLRENVEKFITHGGEAILWPRPWNQHEEATVAAA